MIYKITSIETFDLNIPLQSPVKPLSWGEKIIDADEEKPPCAARNSYTQKFVGSDDCLYLNIFTKNLSPKKPYAVMIYIHGGGHCSGSSNLRSYSPDYIMMSDVVLVTFNYRLGPLGFLSLKDKSLDVPGNAGMKDQQLAIKFVKDNIQHFGGDPNNVTLFGHSSGGTCVSLHCTVESSRGLFNKAIIMSGSSVAMEGLIHDKNWAVRLAKKLGFDGHDEKEILTFLEKADALAMAEAQYTLTDSDEKQLFPLAFGPCIEPYERDSSFMLKPPIGLLKTAWSNDIDVMVGGTADEGFFDKLDHDVDVKNINYEIMIPAELRLIADEQKLKEFATRLRNFYLKSFTEFEAYIKVNSFNSIFVHNFSSNRMFSQKEIIIVGYLCNA